MQEPGSGEVAVPKCSRRQREQQVTTLDAGKAVRVLEGEPV